MSHMSPSPTVIILMLGWPGPSLPCPCQAQGAGAALQGAVLPGGPQSHPKAHLLFLSHSMGGEGGARRALQGPESPPEEEQEQGAGARCAWRRVLWMVWLDKGPTAPHGLSPPVPCLPRPVSSCPVVLPGVPCHARRTRSPPRACSVILRHKDSSLLLMSGSVTGSWNSAGDKGLHW